MNNTAPTTASKTQRQELGALWKRQGKNETYLTGYVSDWDGSKRKIVVFSSKNKKNENQPDFRIYESLPLENRSGTGETSEKPSAPVKSKKTAPAPAPVQAESSEDADGLL